VESIVETDKNITKKNEKMCKTKYKVAEAKKNISKKNENKKTAWH